MKGCIKRVIAVVFAGMCLLATFGCEGKKDPNAKWGYKDAANVKNVILMIGDGMGPNQVLAGELYNKKKLAMQRLPYHVKVDTNNFEGGITDSAAAATALATGVLTSNGRVGMDTLGENLETIVDIAAGLGKRTGVITTEELDGATPMGFSSHNLTRSAPIELITTAANTSNVNLFLSYKFSQAYLFNGTEYTKIKDPATISDATEDKIYGNYLISAAVEPMSVLPDFVALDGLVLEALEYLSKDEDGFFLMTEGAKIDKAGHNNDFDYMLEELLAFDAAVEVVVEWAMKRDDTVVIVTADHETGGLMLGEGINSENLFSESLWTSTGHTNIDVDCFIGGAHIDFSQYSFGDKERIKNTDVFQIMKSLLVGT